MKDKKSISIIISAYNGETTIVETLESIVSQDLSICDKYEIIVVNDGSTDKTYEVTENYFKTTKVDYTIIDSKENKGLSWGCNQGLKQAKYELIAIIQCDILFENKDSLKKMIETIYDEKYIATYPYILHPYEVWKEYSFWQKAMFDRLVGKKSLAKFAKCVVGHKKYFLESGGYDESITGADDRDMYEKINKQGQTCPTEVCIIHIHSKETNFPISKLLDKEAQEAEATGVSIRKYGLKEGLIPSLLVFIRPAVFLTFLIPIFWPISIVFIYLYTKQMYHHERKNPQIWKVPFVSIARISVYSYYLFKGLITNKTSVRHFDWGALNKKKSNKK